MDVAGEFWYCVACQSGAEEAVAQQLGRKQDIVVFVAKMRTKVGSGGRSALVRMFPGYVFVRMRLTVSLSTVRYTPGVRRSRSIWASNPDRAYRSNSGSKGIRFGSSWMDARANIRRGHGGFDRERSI